MNPFSPCGLQTLALDTPVTKMLYSSFLLSSSSSSSSSSSTFPQKCSCFLSLNWNFNTMCRMMSVRGRLLVFGNLTYFDDGFRSSNICRNGQQRPTIHYIGNVSLLEHQPTYRSVPASRCFRPERDKLCSYIMKIWPQNEFKWGKTSHGSRRVLSGSETAFRGETQRENQTF